MLTRDQKLGLVEQRYANDFVAGLRERGVLSSMTKLLSVGRGLNRRITKAGEAAMRHFDELVVAHLKSIGATPPPDGAYPQWIVQTVHGRMRVTPHGDWIAQSFMDWPKDYNECIKHARERGFRHWKWNFHYDLGAAESEVEHWKQQLQKVLP